MAPCWRTRSEFDVNKDFAHIGMIVGSAVLFVAASPKLGISTFPEFVALAKSKPGQIAVGTNGTGRAAAFRRSRAGEEGKRADHGGAL